MLFESTLLRILDLSWNIYLTVSPIPFIIGILTLAVQPLTVVFYRVSLPWHIGVERRGTSCWHRTPDIGQLTNLGILELRSISLREGVVSVVERKQETFPALSSYQLHRVGVHGESDGSSTLSDPPCVAPLHPPTNSNTCMWSKSPPLTLKILFWKHFLLSDVLAGSSPLKISRPRSVENKTCCFYSFPPTLRCDDPKRLCHLSFCILVAILWMFQSSDPTKSNIRGLAWREGSFKTHRYVTSGLLNTPQR